MSRQILWAGVLLALVAFAPAHAGDKKTIRVVIIDGQNNHNWVATTPVLKKELEDSGRFTVEVATSPQLPKLQQPSKPKDPNDEKAVAKYQKDLAAYEAALPKFKVELKAAQDAFVRAYRALAGYDVRRIRELRLRPWLATIVLNLCRTRIGRRVATGARPLSLDAAPPGSLEPATDERSGPAAVAIRRDIAAGWADLLLTLPPAYRTAVVLRHVDGLSYPDVALALERPEGTVKAQVHRGLALLRTAFEAAQRREREEMTA